MKKKYVIYAILFVCFSLSCNRNENTEGQIITLKVDLDNPDPVSVYDLFEKIELIPLETNKNSLISAIAKIEYYKGKYYVYDKRQHLIFIFDEEGKYLGRVGNIGNGPEEYHTITNFCIDRKKDLVIILTISRSLCAYHLDGTFAEKKPVSISVKNFINVIPFNNENFLFYSYIYGPEDQLFLYSGKENALIRSYYKEDIPINIFALSVFHAYDGIVYFFKPFSNGVYRVDESKIEMVYRWDYGKDAIDLNKYNLPNDQRERHNALASIMNNGQLPFYDNEQRQTDQYYYVEQVTSNTRKTNTSRKIFYNKHNKKSFVFTKFSEGLAFIPDYWTNDYIIGISNVNDIDNVSCEILNEENCRIFRSRKETDNPYLVKYIFKK